MPGMQGMMPNPNMKMQPMQGMPGMMPNPNMKMQTGMQVMPGVRNPPNVPQQPQQPQQQSQPHSLLDEWETKRKTFSLEHFNSLPNTQDKCQ